MIATIGFVHEPHTGFTYEHHTCIWYDDCDDAQLTFDEKELLRLENADKATAMMVTLARAYKAHKLSRDIRKTVDNPLRTLFAISGKLSKRTRRIKKAR